MDWIEGLKKYHIWHSMAMQDIRNRYRRSMLGPVWITITMGLTILCMGPLYGMLFAKTDPFFGARLGIGLIIWNYLSAVITDSVECYIQAEHYIKNVKLPYSLYVYRVIARQVIILGHNIFLLIPIYIIYPELLNENIAIAIMVFPIFVMFSFFVSAMVSIVCARYRDLGPLVNNLMQLLFFVTPVIWPLSQLSGERKLIVEYNPLFYVLEMLRNPLMGNGVDLYNVIVVVIMNFLMGIVGFMVYKKYASRIAFWL